MKCTCSRRINEAHLRALEVHNQAYDEMLRVRSVHGRDSAEYRQARADVVAAAGEVTNARKGKP